MRYSEYSVILSNYFQKYYSLTENISKLIT